MGIKKKKKNKNEKDQADRLKELGNKSFSE
jgi:hypothetical protein